MTLPTGQISASDFNNELRRPWNQPLSADDYLLRSILGRQNVRVETSAAEYRGRYLYAPYGTIYQGPYCQGYALGYLMADGNGGSFFSVIENPSVQCGYTPPPPPPSYPARGTLLSQYCEGPNLVGQYADGGGGSYVQVVEYNSSSCGGGHVNG